MFLPTKDWHVFLHSYKGRTRFRASDIRLLTTWFTVDSTNPVEIRSPFVPVALPVVGNELLIIPNVAVRFPQLLQ